MTEDPSLAALLDETAVRHDEVERIERDGTITWRRAGRDFTMLDGVDAASFRLGQVLVAAALRTPDVRASDHGPDWVRFAPARIDRFARDRATSWFEAAYRRAGDG